MQRHALERLQLTVDEWTQPRIPRRGGRAGGAGFVRSEALRATCAAVLGAVALLSVAGLLFAACPTVSPHQGPLVAPAANELPTRGSDEPKTSLSGLRTPVSGRDSRRDGTLRARAAAEARNHGVDPRLYAAVIQIESAWRPGARGRAGEIGLAQLRPETARRLGVDPHDPAQNLRGGAMLLRANYDRLGDWTRAIEAYNGRGPAARRYAQRVLRAWEASDDAGGGEQ